MGDPADTGAEEHRVEWDAFISYSSIERRQAHRVHRFLESYEPTSLGRRLQVFLDHTDIRGGELSEALRTAIEASRTLIVCLSPHAAESRWVAKEIRHFLAKHGPSRLVIVTIAGDEAKNRIPDLDTLDVRRHDVRKGWFAGLLKGRARLEMLRVLAFVSDVPLRELRNWHRRRTIKRSIVGLAAALLLPAAILSYPLEFWEPLSLSYRNAPLYPVAAEVENNKLWVASRFRAPGPQGFRNYIRTTPDALDNRAQESFEEFYQTRRRLLPVRLLSFANASALPRFPDAAPSGRPLVGTLMVTQPHQGRFVAVRALGLTEEEYDEARDLAADTHIPIPSSRGALITVIDEKGTRSVEVAGLNPTWQERAPDGSPTSPFKGLPIAWSDSGEIWLGAPGWDALTSGGLWHSADAGGHWTQIPDFVSVTSIILLADASVVVAETHVDRWRSFFLEPYPSRVVVKSRDQAQWRPASMPPYGTRSELELCGTLDGRPVVRVDGTVYSGGTGSLWRFLTTRSRPVS